MPHLFNRTLGSYPSWLLSVVLATTLLTGGGLQGCLGTDDDKNSSNPADEDDDTPSSTPANGSNQSSWSPNFPGLYYGCIRRDALDPMLDHCIAVVEPLPEDMSIHSKSCGPEYPDYTVEESGCPSPLNTSSGPVVATCQETPNPTTDTGFPRYTVRLDYEADIILWTQGRLDSGDADSLEEACEQVISTYQEEQCGGDGVVGDIGLSSFDCTRLAD
jgi:hypothetical protein